MNIRVRFGKEGALRFIGHLDVLRTYQKIFRRAGIPMQYSQGFSPHPIMSFALPLGLCLTSEGEYLDASIEESLTAAQVLERLQQATSEELPVYSVFELPEHAENAMSSVGGAIYRLTYVPGLTQEQQKAFAQAVSAFTARKEIVILKKTKTKEAETDIRPMIFEMKAEGASLYLKLAAGSKANLSQDLLMETFLGELGRTYDKGAWAIRRLDLLRADGSSLGQPEGGQSLA